MGARGDFIHEQLSVWLQEEFHAQDADDLEVLENGPRDVFCLLPDLF